MNLGKTLTVSYSDLFNNVTFAKAIGTNKWVSVERYKVRAGFLLRLVVSTNGLNYGAAEKVGTIFQRHASSWSLIPF